MVYVDDLQKYPGKGRWCHMMTDGDLSELHAMADRIGLSRKWFQDRPDHPHYDLRAPKRQAAILVGAKPVSSIEMVRRCSAVLKKIERDTAKKFHPCEYGLVGDLIGSIQQEREDE